MKLVLCVFDGSVCNTISYIYSVNCEWSSYGNWSECSVTCGDGHKRSNRTILQPALHGGIECEGNSSKVEKCILEACIGMHFINEYHEKYILPLRISYFLMIHNFLLEFYKTPLTQYHSDENLEHDYDDASLQGKVNRQMFI